MLFSLSDGDGVNRAGVRTKAHVQAFKGEPDVRTRRNSGSDGRPPAAGDANASPSSSPAGSDVVPLFTSFVLQRAKVVINVSKCKVGVSLSVLKVSASLLFFSSGLFAGSVSRPVNPVSRLEISASRLEISASRPVFQVALPGLARRACFPAVRHKKGALRMKRALRRETQSVKYYFTTTFLPLWM